MKSSRVAQQRRKAVLWDAVEQRKSREDATYAETFAAAESALSNDAGLASADREIAKDIKRTFPWMESFGDRESATRNVLLAYSYRNPAVGYCQSLNFICGALLMAPLSEEDAYFALATIIEDLMPSDYYTRDDDLLGARIDQLVFAELLAHSLPKLNSHLDEMCVPLGLFSLQWFMCLFAKDLPLSLVLRVWDVMFVYGDHALFAVGMAILSLTEAKLLQCTDMSELYESLKNLGSGLLQRDAEAAHRVVIQSLDTLMRTPLVERVEEGRTRHRREHHEQLAVAANEYHAINGHYANEHPPSQPSSPQGHVGGDASDVGAAGSPTRAPSGRAPSGRSPACSPSMTPPRVSARHATPLTHTHPLSGARQPSARAGGYDRGGYDAAGALEAARRGAGAAGGGSQKALHDLYYFLRRSERLLRQRRDMLESRNIELRAQIVARGLYMHRPATASLWSAMADFADAADDEISDSVSPAPAANFAAAMAAEQQHEKGAGAAVDDIHSIAPMGPLPPIASPSVRDRSIRSLGGTFERGGGGGDDDTLVTLPPPQLKWYVPPSTPPRTDWHPSTPPRADWPPSTPPRADWHPSTPPRADWHPSTPSRVLSPLATQPHPTKPPPLHPHPPNHSTPRSLARRYPHQVRCCRGGS